MCIQDQNLKVWKQETWITKAPILCYHLLFVDPFFLACSIENFHFRISLVHKHLSCSNIHQRDHNEENQRTQLFGSNYSIPASTHDTQDNIMNQRSSNFSSNNNTKGLDYNGSMLSQLESQSDEQMGVMSGKVKQLKNLTLRMGDEIRSSNSTLGHLGETFEGTSAKLKKTFSNMMVMASRSRIPLKTWLLIFAVIFILFFYVWVR